MEGEIQQSEVAVDPGRPLLIVDVDEVIALFMLGFGRFVEARGYEVRVERFSLFKSLYAAGAREPLPIDLGRALFDDFFRTAAEEIDPAPGAPEALATLAQDANVVILTNAPDHARQARANWLATHGMAYPLVINTGWKGEAVARLAARTDKPAAFVDDILGNLDSVAEHAPQVRRFQMVADPRLRPLAPAAPERHERIDDWAQLGPALAQALGIAAP